MSRVTVLLADDVAAYRALIRVVLENEDGFEVVAEAADGGEAIELSAAVRPDIVLLDVAMPVMDGLEAIPQILARSPETRVIVLSGFARAQLEEEALRLGADGYLEKSEAPATIVETLTRLAGAGRRA